MEPIIPTRMVQVVIWATIAVVVLLLALNRSVGPSDPGDRSPGEAVTTIDRPAPIPRGTLPPIPRP